MLFIQCRVELSDRLDHSQSRPHGSLRVVFVRLRITEVHQKAIAEILGDMPVVSGNDLGAGVLVRAHHLAPVLGVEPIGERRRVDEVAEQNGELSALRVGFLRRGWGDLALGGRRDGCRTCPDQPRPFFDHGIGIGVEQLFLQRFESLVVEVELHLQRAIGHPPATTKQVDHPIDHRVEVHRRPPGRARRAGQPDGYANSAVDLAVPCGYSPRGPTQQNAIGAFRLGVVQPHPGVGGLLRRAPANPSRFPRGRTG